MLWVTTVSLAVVVVVLLLIVGDEVVRRPKERLARTADLLLSLHVDAGLALLEKERRRSDVWWTDADPLTRREIDRTLSTWDLVASLGRSGRIDQGVVVEHFSTQVVDLWELAYPYVQHRHEQQPRLWESLAELYLDAYETAQGTAPEIAPPAAAAAPEPIPQVEPEAAAPPAVQPEEQLEPPAPQPEPEAAETVVAPEPSPTPEPVEAADAHQLLIAALRDLPREVPQPPAPRSPHTTVTVETHAAPAEQQPAPTRAVFEEVVDLVPHPPTGRG